MLVCIEYILLFILIICVLYSITRGFSTFYLGLLFTRVVTRVIVYLEGGLPLQKHTDMARRPHVQWGVKAANWGIGHYQKQKWKRSK